jgi:hypothetical protein
MIIRLIKDFGAAMISQTGIKVYKDVTEHPICCFHVFGTRILHKAR